MGFYLFYIFFLFFCFSSSSGFIDSGFIEDYMKAKSQFELKALIKDQESKKELKTLCLRQLQKNTVPYFCYKWLDKKLLEDKNLLSYLNERCYEFSSHIKDLKKIKQILKNDSLSPFCRKKIEQQKSLLEYQLRDLPAPQLFKHFIEDF